MGHQKVILMDWRNLGSGWIDLHILSYLLCCGFWHLFRF